MTSKNFRFATATLILACCEASAMLSTASHPDFGVGSITSDSAQGLYWLSPSFTNGLSYNEITRLLLDDARFHGFRLANQSELKKLYEQANISDINQPGYGALYGTQSNVPGVQKLQSLVGVTYSIQVSGQILSETAGYVGSSFISSVNGLPSITIGNLVLRTNVPTASGLQSFASAYTEWGSVPVGSKNIGVGVWLVSSVPEPSAIALTCGGLLLLLLRRPREGD